MSDIQFGVCLPIFACPGVQLFRTPGFAELDPVDGSDLGETCRGAGLRLALGG